MAADPDDDLHHPILPDPYLWEVLEFTYRRDPDDWCETYIDLLFARDGVERRNGELVRRCSDKPVTVELRSLMLLDHQWLP